MGEMADFQKYDDIQESLNRRYRMKKRVNLIISVLTAVLGVTSFLYGLRLEPFPRILRWMTVDGTIFTTVSAILCIAVNLVEIQRNTELTRVSVYCLRLSSAVAELVIFIVVLFHRLPFFRSTYPSSTGTIPL